jgi:8-oxo-dGTP diphosphatase
LKNIQVVAAIIYHNDKILCVQRGYSKYDYINQKFEFPGGKVEKGETDGEALIREIKEELEMEISEMNFLIKVEHEYPDFQITMNCFECKTKTKDLTLNEHIDYKWLDKSELESLDWAAADTPIVNRIILSN